MVIIKVMGGLGNQLFQYAFGREIEAKFGYQVKYDLGYYENIPENDTQRDVYIIRLITPEKVASEKEVEVYLKKSRFKKIMYGRSQAVLYEKDVNVYNLNGVKDNRYYIGFWQSEKYFIDVKDDVRRTIIDKFIIESPKASALKSSMEEECSISVHVRGGDYYNSANINTFGGICDKDYYKKAYEYTLKQCKESKFYIFTNDVKWAKSILDVSSDKMVMVGDVLIEDNPVEELMLMAGCKHNIIANSTFSWWGAWLNNYENKIVIAPSKWANDSTGSEILIDEWVKY